MSRAHWPPTPLQALGMACPEQSAPLGQFWVRVHIWSTAGQEGMDGQAGPTVTELHGWTGFGGRGMRMGLSQQGTLHSKELGSLVGVSSFRSPWHSQDAIESKMFLFLLGISQHHPRPVAHEQPWGSSVRTWKGKSNGETKRIHFKEPRGLAQGFVLMTRDSRGVPLPRVGGSRHPQMLSEVGTGIHPWG